MPVEPVTSAARKPARRQTASEVIEFRTPTGIPTTVSPTTTLIHQNQHLPPQGRLRRRVEAVDAQASKHCRCYSLFGYAYADVGAHVSQTHDRPGRSVHLPHMRVLPSGAPGRSVSGVRRRTATCAARNPGISSLAMGARDTQVAIASVCGDMLRWVRPLCSPS